MNLFNRQMLWTARLVIIIAVIMAAVTGHGAEVTPTSVTLSWTAPGDDGAIGTAAQYDIRYSLTPITDANWDPAFQAVGEPVPLPAGSAESFTVSGLAPSTTYYFGIKAADEVPNWSVLSNVIIATTADENTPPAVISNLLTGVVTINSIALGWTAPGDDGSSGTAAQYDLRYSTSMITDANWAAAAQVSGVPSPQTAGSAEFFIVPGLSDNVTYYFAIKTADEVPNWSGLSNVTSATTQEDITVPPAPVLVSPADGAIDLVQPVTLDWADIGGVDSYQIQVADTVSMTSLILDSALVNSSLDVSSLEPGATSYWRARAHNSAGWGNWSATRNFATLCPIPAVPILATPADGEVNLNSPVMLDWSDVAEATSYLVQVDETSDFASPVASSTTSASNYNVWTLQDGQQYFWRVNSINDCGQSNWSAVRSFHTTDTTVPMAIAGLNAVPGGNNGEVTLTWNATGDDGSAGTAATYDIRYSLAPITEVNWGMATQVSGEPSPQPAGNAESHTIGGLDNSLVYYFGVKAGDEAGNISPLSNVANAKPADKNPPARIMDLSAETGSGDGELSLEWTAPGDDGTEGIVSAYLIKYSRDLITVDNWDQASIYEDFVAPRAAGQLQTVYMTGLEPGAEYYVGIKAYDESANGSELSNVVSEFAGTDMILVVDDENTEPVSPGFGAKLHSSHPVLAVHNITAQGENFYYFEVARDSFFINMAAVSSPIAQQDDDVTTWKVSEKLDGSQTYYWRARANSFSYCATSAFSVQPQAHAFPNPFNLNMDELVTFTDIPEGADLLLMSVSGTTVREWSNITDDNLTWDGTNESGSKVASGTYLWFVEDSDASGKIIVMR